jgi:hypothetical protein
MSWGAAFGRLLAFVPIGAWRPNSRVRIVCTCTTERRIGRCHITHNAFHEGHMALRISVAALVRGLDLTVRFLDTSGPFLKATQRLAGGLPS